MLFPNRIFVYFNEKILSSIAEKYTGPYGTLPTTIMGCCVKIVFTPPCKTLEILFFSGPFEKLFIRIRPMFSYLRESIERTFKCSSDFINPNLHLFVNILLRLLRCICDKALVYSIELFS